LTRIKHLKNQAKRTTALVILTIDWKNNNGNKILL